MIRAILFDISGVLYQDQQPIEGAVDSLNRLAEGPLALRFVTNTSRKTGQQVYEDLRNLGFHVQREQIFTAPQAIRRRLHREGLRPLCLIHPNLEEEFAEFSTRHPNAVVLTDAGHRFTYVHLNQAFQLLQTGAPLLAVGRNRYFLSQGQLFLDAGPFVAALEYALGRPATLLGKPSADFFLEVLDTVGCQPVEALMIGDDLEADVLGARQAGLQACLVRTGKFQPGDATRLPDGAHLADSVVDAVQLARAL